MNNVIQRDSVGILLAGIGTTDNRIFWAQTLILGWVLT